MDRNHYIAQLKEGMQKMDLPPLPLQVLESLTQFQEILVKWNKKINLTAHRKVEASLERNFLDSLILPRHLHGRNEIMDLGSGAGFPGLVVKIALPESDLTLVESDQRKCAFLATVIRELKLNKVEVLNTYLETKRVKELKWVDRFAAIVSRATIPIPEILPLAASCLTVGGVFLGMVQEGPFQSKEGATPPLEFSEKIPYRLPFSGQGRKLLIFQKK